jgi:hypothetical protein
MSGIQELTLALDVKEFMPKGFAALYVNHSIPILGSDPDATIFYNESR